MAEDFRQPVADQGDLAALRRKEIIAEALRQEESCLYTSTSLYEWLRCVRWQRRAFIVAPIILGGLAGFSLLKSTAPDWVVAILAFVASLFPALAEALDFKTSVDELARHAATFKALQDKFRRLARVTAPFVTPEEAASTLSELMDHLDIARSTSITAPPWAFKRAQKKVAGGDYDFAVDRASRPKGVK